MRDVVLKQLSPDRTREENLNHLRHILQILLLKILHESPIGSSLAFKGGTALRMLHGLPRFSENLDFSLVKPEKYDFEQLVTHIQQSLEKLYLPADLKAKSQKTLHNLYIRFRELLHDAGLSSHPDEKLPIRLEIDTNPPEGPKTEISLISEVYTFPILHFDLPFSFATKLHACLFRRYAKGRDFYDLMWYLGKKVRPNLEVLNNAIAQTEAKAMEPDGEGLKQHLLKRVHNLDVARLRNDVARFLAHPEEIALLDRGLMREVIRGYEFTT